MSTRLGSAIAALLLLAVGAGTSLALGAPHSAFGRSKGGAGRFANGRPDTTTVYGDSTFTRGSTGTSTTYTSSFGADTSGWRYFLQVWNGSGGQNRVSSGSLSLNGVQVLTPTDITGSVDFVSRVVFPVLNNTLLVTLQGTAGTFIKVRIIRMPNPKYVIWGPHKFERVHTSLTQSATFYTPSGAAGPYTFRMDNGEPDGTHRIGSAYSWLNWNTIFATTDYGAGVASREREVSINPDSNLVSTFIYYPDNTWQYITITATDTTAPALHIAWPPQNYVTDSTSVHFAGWTTDETKGTTTVNGQTGVPNPGAFSDVVALSADGRYDIHVVSTNAAGYTTDSVRTVIRAQAPSLVVTQPSTPITTTTTGTLTLAGNWIALTNVTVTANGDTLPSGMPSGSFSKNYTLALGANTFNVRASDAFGHASVVTRTVIYEPLGAGATEPVAPPLAVTQLDDFRSQTAFLYGSGGVQVGPDTSVFSIRQVAVIRGRVVQATETSDTLALAHVTVKVVGHSEYDSTESRATGNFDLVVNGGGQLTLEFSRTGFATARRFLTVPIRDYVRLDDVALKGFDSKQVLVDLTVASIAQGTRIDEGGAARTSTLMFKAGTQATGVAAGGGTVALGSSIHVRATEFTVGVEGPRRMPAPLPATSAYTHCVNLTAMEAENQGITLVNFSQPVSYYVENFLNLPVGTRVPVGSYTPDAGWKGEEDGRVIKVMSVSGGSAALDVTGDDIADTGTALANLGIDATELQQIAQTYHPGQSVWRSRLNHFSDWDWNMPFWWPAGAILPNGGPPYWLQILLASDHCTNCPGSVIEVENQVLREDIPVVGTPYALHYSSGRATGNRRPYQIRIPLRKGVVPREVSAVLWTMDIAGRHYGDRIQNFPDAGGNPSFAEFVDVEWNGLDGFNRTVVGSRNAHIKVGYAYQNVYGVAGAGGGSGPSTWGNPPSGSRLTTAVRGNEGIIWAEFDVALGTMRNEVAGLGGWSITPNHFYDFAGRGTLYRGDGTVEPGERMTPTIQIVNRSSSDAVFDVAFAADGGLYYAEAGAGADGTVIKRLDPDGVTITIKVGTSVHPDWALPSQSAFALDPQGNFYVAEPDFHVVREFLQNGTSRTIAGQPGVDAESGDGGPAVSASLRSPSAIALAPDGTLFVADRTAHTIRRIAPDGIITRFAGTGSAPTNPINDAEVPAIQIPVNPGNGHIRVGPRGDLVVADGGGNRVRRISPDGVNHTMAIMPFPPIDVQYAPDGVLYVATGNSVDPGNNGLYRLEPGQPAIQVAGLDPGATSPVALGGPPAPARSVQLNFQSCMAFNRDGEVVIGRFAQGYQSPMGVVRPVLPGFTLSEDIVVSSDASEKFVFDISGRHVRTLDALTGGTRFVFGYQGFGSGNVRLVSIRDPNGDVTTIHRNSSGVPLDVSAPDGQVTGLSLDGNSYLSQVTNPTGTEAVHLFTGEAGLLDSLQDERGYSHQFQYENDGRLRRDLAADGYSTALAAVSVPSDSLPDRTVQATSALGRVSAYKLDFQDERQTEIRSAVGADNLTVVSARHGDESENVLAPDGTAARRRPGPDPEFGMQAPFADSLTVTLPSGTTTVVQTTSFSRTPNFGGLSEDVALNNRTYQLTYVPSGLGGGAMGFRPPSGSSRLVTTSVDSVGRPLVTSLPGTLADVVTHYDSRGRVDTLRVGGRRWEYHYEDARGRISGVRDPLDRVTTCAYDEADRRIWQAFPGGSDTVYFGYDAAGNMTSLKPPGRPFHRFAFTPGGLQRNYGPPAGSGAATDTTHFEYDADHDIVSVNRPDGQAVTLGYDNSGRLQRVTQPRGDAALTYIAGGNGAGEVATVSSPDNIMVTLGYDGWVPISESWRFPNGITGTVTTELDANLWPSTSIVTGSGGGTSAVTYAYDSDGLLISAAGAGAPTLLLQHDPRTSVLDSSRVSGLAVRNGFNAYGELVSTAAWYGADTLFAAVYERDNLGRVTRATEPQAVAQKDRAYGYDPRGRLESVRDLLANSDLARYRFDANGNRVGLEAAADSITAAYDSRDRLLDRGTSHYTYTSADERASQTGPGGVIRTTYDLLGNLLKVSLANGDSIEYVIDGLNRRVGRKVNGVLVSRWVYENGTRVAGEQDSSGRLVKRFIYASRGDVPDVMIVLNLAGSDSTYRLVTDQLGSVRVVVNANTGFVAQKLEYDAWGSVTLDSRPGFQPFGYAGGVSDASTGLVRFGARDYDPEAGVWTSGDPIGVSEGSTNLFSYCFGDPLNCLDPFGTYWEYAQGTGVTTYVDPTTGGRTVVGTGYSGTGLGYKNPDREWEKDTGPIPRGQWTIGPAQTTRLGAWTMNLTPQTPAMAYWRTLFRIHGDAKNPRKRGNASKGCIILPPRVRLQIAKCKDRELRVIP